MRRLVPIVAAALLALGLAAPAVLGAEPPADRQVLISVGGDLEVPTGERVGAVIVSGGHAEIAGEVDALLVVDGTATLVDARAESVVVVNGSASLEGDTVVSGDVRTLDGSVTTAASASVLGDVRGLEADLVGLGLVLGPALVLIWIGFGLATILVALALAALASRQVRAAGDLIARETGKTLLAGFLGLVVPPFVAILAIVTIVGIPVGIGLLVVAWPAVAFLGYLVAAIWIGERVLAAVRGPRETERPYLAATVGVIIVGLLGIVPLATFIVSWLGLGAVLLAGWRVFRGGDLVPSAINLVRRAPTPA